GFGLLAGNGHLRRACRYGQGHYAPLHHFHRDLLLWIKTMPTRELKRAFLIFSGQLALRRRAIC
ncbi:hypothetical protein, partial [Stutzerimonas balearica]|uniref:hypothetical protein n=1 Tax=Stutzerimonas balearica TaxID=74829 RepID=UPI00241F3A59